MTTIRTSIETAVQYLSRHPGEARYTDSAATATLEEGLLVRIEGPGNESAVTDMPASVGGGGSAPSPGWLFRASLAGCVATLIAMRAAQQGVTLARLRVAVDSESDDRGILGLDPSIHAGPLSVRVRVDVNATEAGAEDLQAIVDWSIEHCPVYDALRRAVDVSIVR